MYFLFVLTLLYSFCLYYYFLRFIYLKGELQIEGRRERETEESERDREKEILHSVIRSPDGPGQCWESRSSSGCRDPGHITRELEGKWNSPDLRPEQRDTDLVTHSPDVDHHGQGWARRKLGARNFTWVFHMGIGDQGLGASS